MQREGNRCCDDSGSTTPGAQHQCVPCSEGSRFAAFAVTPSQSAVCDVALHAPLAVPGTGTATVCGVCPVLVAQVLFAAQEQPELKPLILRKFKHERDVSNVSVQSS